MSLFLHTLASIATVIFGILTWAIWVVGMLILTLLYSPIYLYFVVKYGAQETDTLFHTEPICKPWSKWCCLMAGPVNSGSSQV